MSATMVDQLLKILKKHWLKSPKAVPQKTKFGPKYNDSKCHIWNLFFENIILGIQVFIFVHTLQWTSSEFFFFFLFQVFYQKLSKPTKTSEKDDSSHNTFSLKKPRSFYEPQITWHWNQYAPATQPETFLTLHISVWFKKKHLQYIISWRPRTAFLKPFESKCLYVSVYLRNKTFVPET